VHVTYILDKNWFDFAGDPHATRERATVGRH
jgi:hypothetical protein